MEKQLIFDPESIYWETRSVDSPSFARCVLEIKKLESMASQCYDNMSKEPADVLSSQIKDLVANFKYMIDGKASETRMDKNNNKSNLIDKLLRNKQEKMYTISEEAKKSLFAGFLGKKDQDEMSQ